MFDVVRGGVDDGGGAALGDQAEGADAGQICHDIPPGAGGVDDDRGLEGFVRGGFDVPLGAFAFDTAGTVAQCERAAVLAELAQEALVDGGNIHVERVVLHRAGGGVARAQGGDHFQRLRLGDTAEAGAFFDRGVQIGELGFGRQKQDWAAAHQRDFGEPGRRIFEECPRQAAEFAHVARAVVL